MKNKILILIMTFICLISFSSCKVERTKDFNVIVPDSVYMGDISLDGFSIVRDEESYEVTEDMIKETDILYFYQEGSHDISITYDSLVKTVTINVKRRTFDSSVNLESKTYTYTGEAYTVSVSGILPADAVVYYPLGNTFTNVGTYPVKAIVSAKYYETIEFNATITIESEVA